MESTVIHQSKNGLCYLTLNRPEVLEHEVDDWAQEILSKSSTAITLAKKMHNEKTFSQTK